jgi:hypothetical protein
MFRSFLIAILRTKRCARWEMLPGVTKKERKMTRIGAFRMEIEKASASKALVFGLVATLMSLIMLLAVKPAHTATTITVNSTGD